MILQNVSTYQLLNQPIRVFTVVKCIEMLSITELIPLKRGLESWPAVYSTFSRALTRLDCCIPLKGVWVLASLVMNKWSQLLWNEKWLEHIGADFKPVSSLEKWSRPSSNPKLQGQKSELHGNHGIQLIQIIVDVIFRHPLGFGLHLEAHHVGTPPRNGCLGCIWASSTLPQVPKQCIWSTLLNSQVESCLLSPIAKVYSSFSFKEKPGNGIGTHNDAKHQWRSATIMISQSAQRCRS